MNPILFYLTPLYNIYLYVDRSKYIMVLLGFNIRVDWSIIKLKGKKIIFISPSSFFEAW